MYRIKELDAGEDISGFSTWLGHQGVKHRITREGDAQVLWLASAEQSAAVLAALEQYMSEEDVRARVDRAGRMPVRGGRWQPSPRHAPVVCAIIAVAAVLAWATGLGRGELAAWLMYVDPRGFDWQTLAARLSALSDTMASGQFWRLITPDFLHFSLMHILFNAVMLWFLGSQVEYIDGRGRFLALFLVSSLISNTLQFLASGPLFGGLSGVVYGVLGYCWLSQQRVPRFQFPPALMTFAVVWMIIGFTPLPVMLGIGRMANEAHLGGLLGGLLMAVIMTPPRSRQVS
ncbi:GlpG protein [Marinobacter daqiaonensis]|uniref:GlpG protein n=1 Tax=Marinobacter daqiaonensis TaxID=650891 RepID=A0A1I6JCF6_9GAMM|nr:rhomboid family intramembrane serine protease [Marinobacter daqiaonensis]SFR76695.1 GlpG protein [Marinobacter daqiaonensis]